MLVVVFRLVIVFRRRRRADLTLRSLPFQGVLPKIAAHMMHGGMMGGGMSHGMMGGMGHGMMGGRSGNPLPVGSDFPIFKVRVTRETTDSPKLPTHLSTIRRYQIADVANAHKPIPIGISEGPGSMLLNGRAYASNDLLPFERVPVNSVQLLEIFHAHGGSGGGHGSGAAAGASAEKHEAAPAPESGAKEAGMGGMQHGGQGGGKQGMGGMMGGGMGMMGGGGMMFSMAHPIHLHGQQFQVISRSIGAEEADDYATVKEGLISSGWKDTVLVMPGEKVRIIKPFEDFKGLFMYHCHNLEHEDMGMMREFLIE